MKKYRDIENGREYTESELFAEFIHEWNKGGDLYDRYPVDETGGDPFGAYIYECTGKNGFLEEV